MSVDDKFVTECLSKIDQIVKISRNAITQVTLSRNVHRLSFEYCTYSSLINKMILFTLFHISLKTLFIRFFLLFFGTFS